MPLRLPKYILLLSAFFLTCNDASVDPSSDSPILYESRFEVNGQPSMDGWTHLRASDPGPTFFSTDVPQGAGGWSIGLKARDSLGKSNALVRTIPINRNVNSARFRLVHWRKVPFDDMSAIPFIFVQYGNGELHGVGNIVSPFFTTGWQSDTLITDVINTLVREVSIVIGAAQYGAVDTSQYVLYNKIRLETF